MIPDKMAEKLVPARSYGLIENVGFGRTAIDQSDGEDEYFETCADWYLECYLFPRPNGDRD